VSRTRLVALAATLLAVAASLTACRSPLTLAALDHRVHATSLEAFRSWWVREQAGLQRTTPATIERWVLEAPHRLDDADARRGAWDLSTDLCSFAPDAGPSFDFRWPCIRHDLAWRNLKRLDQQRAAPVDTRARRMRANDRFLADLRATCDLRRGLARTSCRSLALTYHRAVVLVT
jgi:hypothetical protein